MFRKYLVLPLIAVMAIMAGAVVAQVTLPVAPNVDATNDRVLVIPKGTPTTQAVYVAPSTIGQAVILAQRPLYTAFSYTFTTQKMFIFENGGTTVAVGALKMPANPGDGQEICFFSDAAVTAFNQTPNTTVNASQTVIGDVHALVANTRYCYTYVASQAYWYRTQ